MGYDAIQDEIEKKQLAKSERIAEMDRDFEDLATAGWEHLGKDIFRKDGVCAIYKNRKLKTITGKTLWKA